MNGRVKWFNNEKGYGFIEFNDHEDIFVHYSAILTEGYKTLVEGQYVDFELVTTDKGLQAKNVIEIKTTLVYRLMVMAIKNYFVWWEPRPPATLRQAHGRKLSAAITMSIMSAASSQAPSPCLR